MGVAAIFGIFAAIYFWFPKMFGRMMSEPLGKIHFWFTFVGAYLIFMPMHWLGIAGGIRRYADYTAVDFLKPLQTSAQFHNNRRVCHCGAAQLLFLYNFFWSLKHGAKASKNPWNATTLEWDTDSPPPLDNFGGHYPSVYRGPYEFSVPGADRRFHPSEYRSRSSWRERNRRHDARQPQPHRMSS